MRSLHISRVSVKSVPIERGFELALPFYYLMSTWPGVFNSSPCNPIWGGTRGPLMVYFLKVMSLLLTLYTKEWASIPGLYSIQGALNESHIKDRLL